MSFRRGRVVLEDHSLSAERALAALGGPPLPCMALLAAWPMVSQCAGEVIDHLDHAEAGGPLPLWEPPAWLSAATWVTRPSGAAAGSFRPVEAPWAKKVLDSVPPGAAAVIARAAVMAVERRWGDHPSVVRRTFSFALFRRVRGAVIDTMEASPVRRLPPPSVDCRLAVDGATPAVNGTLSFMRADATARLPLSWLVTVWSRGLAVVDGCFILNARGGPEEAEVAAVRWERRTPFAAEAVTAPARVSRDGDGDGVWRLEWT